MPAKIILGFGETYAGAMVVESRVLLEGPVNS